MKNKRMNFKEIRKSFMIFLSVFIMLVFFSFLSVFSFFKSSEYQQEKILSDVIKYKELLNKHYILKNRVDTIYYHMTLLNTGKVRNDYFLENYITKDINEVKEIIGDDKENEFKHYTILFKDIDSILKLKNQLIVISNEEKLAFRDLDECMNKFKTVHKKLVDDPLRKFNKK